MYFTYVLRSLSNGRLYVGQTNDLSRRLEEHNSGQSKYTRFTRPFEVVYVETYIIRVEAVRRERELKSGQGRAWLKKKLVRAVA